MNRSRVAHYLLCFVLVFGVLSGLLGGRVVLATQEGSNGSFLLPPSQEEPPPEEPAMPTPELKVSCKYPTLRGLSGDSFEFELEVSYFAYGEEEVIFYLTAEPPSPEWTVSITAGLYAAKKEIGTITLGRWAAPEKVSVNLTPSPGKMPEPGEYLVTFEASLGDISESIELTAEITAKYEFSMFLAEAGTLTRRVSTKVTAGEDNHLSILLVNTGSAPIEDITFSSSKPEGWSITFNPDKVDSLGAGYVREVDVIITPPKKTIAGWWEATLWAESEQISDSLELKINVLTSTIWGGVGIGIVVAVIAGLAVLFRRLGRR